MGNVSGKLFSGMKLSKPNKRKVCISEKKKKRKKVRF
jgi:hypothetical protein